MKVETQELPDSEVALSIEIEDARVERALDAAYRRAANRVNIAGFRRGKAPRPLVERVIGKESLFQDALSQLLPEVYEEAARETNVRGLTEPEFDVESVSPLRAKATVVVQPRVELGDYLSVHRDPPAGAVAPDEIDAVLGQLRESHAEWVPVERAAELQDRVAIDVTGVDGDRTIVAQEDIEYVLNPENKAPLPGFVERLVGMQAGETRTFDLVVPADDEDSAMAGKTVAFRVAAKDVKAKELPELDDDFATTLGSYQDLADLRAKVEGQLKERAEFTARRALEEDILNEVFSSTTLAIPEKLVNQQAQRMQDRLLRDLDSRGLTIEQYQRITRRSAHDLEAEFRSDAERSLKRSFVLTAIAEQQDIRATDEEVTSGIREALAVEGADQRALRRAVDDSDIRQRVESALLEQRALKWLVEHVTGRSEDSTEGAASEPQEISHA